MFEIATGREGVGWDGDGGRLWCKLRAVIVHIIPVWSSAVVPPPDGVLRRGSKAGLFPTDTKKDCYKE